MPSLVGALAVGAAVRIVWAVVATPDTVQFQSDPYEYLSYADAFASFREYRINGQVTAFFPNGWPLLLSPVVFVSNQTGWFGHLAGAAAVSVACSTFAIWATFRLGARWFDPTVGRAAAWIIALSPALIAVVATPITESSFIAVLLASLLALSRVLDEDRATLPGYRALIGFGVLTAFLVQIRSQGMIVLAVGAILVGRRFGVRRTARAAAWVLLGTLVVFAPATMRNGVQIGFWSPVSTGNLASSTCMAHHEGATGWYVDDAALLAACHWGAPHAGNDAEADWARQMPGEAVRYALTHPGQEGRLALKKTWILFGQDRLGGALEFTELNDGAPASQVRWFVRVIGVARVLMLLGTAAALLASRRARGARVLWAVPALLALSTYAGAAGARAFLPLVPFLSLFSAEAAVAAVRRWPDLRHGAAKMAARRSARLKAVASPSEQPTSTVPAPRPPRRPLTIAGRPLHPMFAAVTIGFWVAVPVFDLVSLLADVEWVYARGAWLLCGLGVGVGFVAAGLGLMDLLAIERPSATFDAGRRHLVAMDVALVLFAASFVVRARSDFAFHDSAPALAITASLLGLAALATGVWLGLGLTYGLGVGVSTDAETVAPGAGPIDPEA